METAAAMLLTLFAVVVLINMVNGTLGSWFKAKFLHQTPPAKATP